jgi:predicted DNA-binding transcriptional regulator AlpA
LSQRSTDLGRLARHSGARPPRKRGLIVYTYDEAAAITGVARRTLERLIAVGKGPSVIELSSRRRGILETDLRVWLQLRRRAPLGEAQSASL